ncbi:MAG: tRNA dihydrouridine synthase DusB [Nitrospirae bacterium]|nr:MAG: tRNA dihydrouridine synthase DusB [Nitrospirota bacterium]
MLKIGDLIINSKCMLAPMAGVADTPFRLISREAGCVFAFSEMISAKALAYRSKNTLRMLPANPVDRPIGLQLLGDDEASLLKAVDISNSLGFELLDFNAACPVGKVTAKGAGSALLKEPSKLKQLLRVMVRGSNAPVTLKIRSGWDENSVNARDVALLAQDEGVKALFIHGRTRMQGYRGSVDYEVIKEVKQALQIPVIASGDCLSPQLVKKMFDETGCDGVAVARGALGNPWIFRDIEEYLKGGVIPERPSLDETADTMTRHLDLCIAEKGGKRGVMLFRKHLVWYIRGLAEIRRYKERAFKAVARQEMIGLIEEIRVSEKKIIIPPY